MSDPGADQPNTHDRSAGDAEAASDTASSAAATPPDPAEAAAAIQAAANSDARFVPRVISLIMLLAVVLLVAAMFFRVMLQFVAPLFLAAVLVVIFEPLHRRVVKRLPGRPQWAALVTTLLVALGVLIPTTWLGLNAFFELKGVVDPFLPNGNAVDSVAEQTDGADDAMDDVINRIRDSSTPIIDWYEKTFQADFDVQLRQAGREAGKTLLSTGVHTLTATISFLFGLGIMAFAMYYFLADGPAMVEAFVRLSPLDDDYERELLEKFSEVSRAVVIATLLSAVAQGLLAGIGYYFALEGGPIFLLTAITMLMAIVPFVGATIIWGPVVAWVYFYQGDTAWAIGLFLWCAIAVSNIDNIIKPYVLHGQSNLHPLLALLSVLGGVSVLGPVGILVGPMLVAFLQALLNMLRKELDDLKNGGTATETPAAEPPPAASTATA